MDLKRQITQQAKKHGAALIGFTSVERWSKYNEIDKSYFPQNIFPFSKTVIVFGLPIFIPMLDSTPSIIYSELYNSSNRLLDDLAYKLTLYLQNKGYKTAFFPRDAYGDISVLVEQPEAAFSHVIAGKYAGLGTIGYNHTLITKEYGPRIRLVSIFTEAEIASDKMKEKDLCIKCELCKQCCPISAFTTTSHLIAEMDKMKCARYHAFLKNNYNYPCGTCIKVCPIGNDRKLYGMTKNKYINEKEALRLNPIDKAYSDWIHLRSFGSKKIIK